MDASVSPDAPKKKSSVLLIVGAGCALLVMFVACGVIAGAVYLGRWAQQEARQFQENPQKRVAELIVQANPDLEIVSSDEKTITIKEKATGNVTTVSFEDAAEGRITFTTDDGTTGELGGEAAEGGMKVTTPEGELSFGAAGSAEGLPDWVPAFPDAQQGEAMFSTRMGDQVTGSFQFKTTKPTDEIIQYYRDALEKTGFSTVATTTFPGEGDGPRATGSFSDTANNRFLTVTVTSQTGETVVMLSYNEGA